jgi:hypothetical protein
MLYIRRNSADAAIVKCMETARNSWIRILLPSVKF